MQRPERGNDELRGRIHMAALRRFTSEGYPGATLKDIALDAGLGSAAHLYYYAPRKEALLLEVAAYATMPIDLLAHEPDDDPRVVLRRFMERYLDALLDERRLLAFRLLQLEFTRLVEAGMENITTNLIDTVLQLEQWFAAQITAGTIREVNAVQAARTVLGVLNFQVQMRAAGGVPTGGDDALVKEVLDLLWHGLEPTS